MSIVYLNPNVKKVFELLLTSKEPVAKQLQPLKERLRMIHVDVDNGSMWEITGTLDGITRVKYTVMYPLGMETQVTAALTLTCEEWLGESTFQL